MSDALDRRPRPRPWRSRPASWTWTAEHGGHRPEGEALDRERPARRRGPTLSHSTATAQTSTAPTEEGERRVEGLTRSCDRQPRSRPAPRGRRRRPAARAPGRGEAWPRTPRRRPAPTPSAATLATDRHQPEGEVRRARVRWRCPTGRRGSASSATKNAEAHRLAQLDQGEVGTGVLEDHGLVDHRQLEVGARVVDRQAPALGHDHDHEGHEGQQALRGWPARPDGPGSG